MTDTYEGHVGTVNIEGRQLTNLRFADDIDRLAGNEIELRRNMKWKSVERRKLMTINNNDMVTGVQLAGNTLD